MGYCITVTLNNCIIKDIRGAFKAIKGISPSEKYKTIVDAFEDWSYGIEVHEDGSIEITEFLGEKLHNDHLLFKTIAAFLRSDAEVEFRGEDGERWKYTFNEGVLSEHTAKLVYEKRK